jgi:RimJ/RimL family protein N-acetyltransferase
LFAFQVDPIASAMAAFASRDREAFEAHQERILADPANLVYAIEVDDRVVGSIVSWDAEEDERAVGYWLARDHWGKGFATEALRSFILVDETRPLFGYVAAHNEASQRVLLHAGFVEARRQRSGDVDEVVFRLDATE